MCAGLDMPCNFHGDPGIQTNDNIRRTAVAAVEVLMYVHRVQKSSSLKVRTLRLGEDSCEQSEEY
jgi:hypothetical protein